MKLSFRLVRKKESQSASFGYANAAISKTDVLNSQRKEGESCTIVAFPCVSERDQESPHDDFADRSSSTVEAHGDFLH